jgi:intracellular sulfur oxidation DsrE/DsrF family protein
MNATVTRRRWLAASAIVSLSALGLAAARPALGQAAPAKQKVVFQVSDADPQKWNLALNNAYNVGLEFGEDGVEMEIVAYGPGIALLKAGSPIAARVTEALKRGVKVVACENTMKAQKLVYADMLPDIGFVPSGVVELMKRQREGYAYIRP